MMTIQQLRYFVAVAQYLHFGEAARACFVSQPSLSHSISDLESELNMKLFIRDNRTVALTPAGKSLYADAQKILEQIDSAIVRARRADSGFTGNINFGTLGGLAGDAMPNYLAKFKQKYPTIDVNFIQTNMRTLNANLLTGTLDVVVTREIDVAGRADEIEWQVLYSEKFGLVCRKGDVCPAEGGIDFNSLRDRNFIFLSKAVTPNIHNYVLALCAARGLSPNIAYSADTLEIACTMIKSGLGIGILPQCAEVYSSGLLDFFPFDGEDAVSKVVVAWHRQNSNPVVPVFLQEFDVDIRT